ncbi:hypothetical protein RQP46_001262 [Phenoliferia psychrophenolica]
MGFVVDRAHDGPLDPSLVDQAVRRMVCKWKMLSGRLEWSEERRVWALQIPDVLPASYATHTFTTSTSDYSYETPALTSTTAAILPRPPQALFRHPSTPKQAADYAKSNAPLLAVHITALSNHPEIIFLGICVPHTLVDATGMGMIVHALECELRGEEWTAPELQSEDSPNRLEVAVLDELECVKDVDKDGAEHSIVRDYRLATVWSKVVLIANVFWEYTFHQTERKNIFLGSDVVKTIVEPVKREVKEATGGKLFVSTGDVLWGCVPYIPVSSLQSTSIASLALLHRHHLDEARVPSTLSALLKLGDSGDIIPRRKMGMDFWHFSNQTNARITDFRGLGPLLSYWSYTVPLAIDHTVLFTELNGGYLLLGSMRRRRWGRIGGVLERLELARADDGAGEEER